jgi:hypothetical protein
VAEGAGRDHGTSEFWSNRLGYMTYHRARISAALGHREETLALLRTAQEQGLSLDAYHRNWESGGLPAEVPPFTTLVARMVKVTEDRAGLQAAVPWIG